MERYPRRLNQSVGGIIAIILALILIALLAIFTN